MGTVAAAQSCLGYSKLDDKCSLIDRAYFTAAAAAPSNCVPGAAVLATVCLFALVLTAVRLLPLSCLSYLTACATESDWDRDRSSHQGGRRRASPLPPCNAGSARSIFFFEKKRNFHH